MKEHHKTCQKHLLSLQIFLKTLPQFWELSWPSHLPTGQKNERFADCIHASRLPTNCFRYFTFFSLLLLPSKYYPKRTRKHHPMTEIETTLILGVKMNLSETSILLYLLIKHCHKHDILETFRGSF